MDHVYVLICAEKMRAGELHPTLKEAAANGETLLPQ